MTIIQTSYPVFESGQVLSSGHLNDLVEYLEQQDRLTRNKLIGIGIACGLEPSLSAPDVIHLSAGCAVTSKGYLIVQEACDLDRRLPYTLPTQSLEEASVETLQDTSYEFFLDDNGDPIDLWELFSPDYVAPPGEATPVLLDAAFLAGKKLLLYLECNLESLKNCDINDCSDKGAEMEFTLRKLLVDEADADAMLAREQAHADAPVDRSAHARYALDPLHVEKINPSAHAIATFEDYLTRILAIAVSHVDPIVTTLRASYDAYDHFLADLYAPADFPNGPFANEGFPELVFTRFSENIFLAQYFYDYLRDVTQSHNEFIEEAIRLDAECCPSDARFPKHVLVGGLDAAPTAAAATVGPGDAVAFDPRAFESGFGPATTPAPYRHHFILSMLHDRGGERLERLRSLHYRTYLLAYRYDTRGLEDAAIRITPSKEADHVLSEKAVPFYYAFDTDDDLHRNWAHGKTAANALDSVYSYQYSTDPNHPLRLRLDDHDFLRMEGIVGKTLGAVLDELIRQKRDLGLSFGIEPVYIGIANGQGKQLNGAALSAAWNAMRKLLVCRMGDLDVVFLILMATLFYYLYYILSLLAAIDLSAFTGGAPPAAPATIGAGAARAFIEVNRGVTDGTLVDLRKGTYVKGTLTEVITTGPKAESSVGGLYATIRNTSLVSGLYDRVIDVVPGLEFEFPDDVVVTQLYPVVSLMDKVELLLETVTAPSLGEFDFAAFDVQYAALAQAFDAFIAMDLGSASPELVAAQEKVAAVHGTVASTGPQTVISSLSKEFQERLLALFQELLLEGYAQRHPGLVHKAGAPSGGTIVLVYAHRSSLIGSVDAHRDQIDAALHAALSMHSAPAWQYGIGPAEEMLGPGGSDDESLDQFVVIADFCVPYLCCDADCSEIDLTTEVDIDDPDEPGPPTPDPSDPVDPEPVEPADTTGDVVVRVVDITTEQGIPEATVTATRAGGPAIIVLSGNDGSFKFETEAGDVSLGASAPGYVTAQPQTATVIAGVGQVIHMKLVPEPPEDGGLKVTLHPRLRGIPLRDATLVVTDAAGNSKEAVRTGTAYLIDDLAPGTYRVRIISQQLGIETEREVTVTASATEHVINLQP